MFDHLLESSHQDDSNKWSNIEFGEEIRHLESIEVDFTHIILSSASYFNIVTICRNSLIETFPTNSHNIRFV